MEASAIIAPSDELRSTEVVRGPNIRPLPEMEPLPEDLAVTVIIKVGDNISTDTIMPAGAKVLPLRSNVEAISEFVFSQVNPDFHKEAKAAGAVAVVGGDNYGQGSSREHAALAPRYLGVRVKLARSFARIHHANLCNFGILPLVFQDPSDYDRIDKGMRIVLHGIRKRLMQGESDIPVEVDGRLVRTRIEVSERQRQHLIAGGALNHVKAGVSYRM